MSASKLQTEDKPQNRAPTQAVGPNDLLAHGLRMHHAGKIDVAAELYQRVLELEPEQPYALHLLGEILLRRKEHARALDLITRAVARLTNHPEAHNNLAAVLQALGRNEEAERTYRRAIELNPTLAIAHSNLGTLLQARGQREEAEAEFQLALAHAPGLADAHLNLGNLRRQAGDHTGAEACYRQAIAAAPEHANAYANLGLALAGQGKTDAALDSYLRAAALDPNLPEIQINIGKLHTGKGRHRDAEACYRRAIELAPDNADFHNTLGVALFAQRRFPDAASALRRACQIKPDFHHAINNLGAALRNSEQLHEAVLCFDRVIELRPKHASAHNNRGQTLVEMGRVAEGLESIKAAMGLKANFFRAHSNYLLSSNYLADITPAALRALHEDFDATFRRGRGPDEALPPRDTDPGRRLRVGYVSPDFKRHSCAFFIEKNSGQSRQGGGRDHLLCRCPVSGRRDRAAQSPCRPLARYDAPGPCRVPRPGDGRPHRHPRRPRWPHGREPPQRAGRPAGAAAGELAGIPGHHRPCVHGLSPHRCARGSAGRERQPLRGDAAAPARHVLVLSAAGGSPRHRAGTRRIGCAVHVWIVQQHPEGDARGRVGVGPHPARSAGLAPDPEIPVLYRRVNARAHRRRVRGREASTASRLELIGWLNKPGDHLRLYERIDLALDPFPYNGTTTTCEALWMGVPVLTLAGQRHAARVGASLLGGLGLDAYVAPSVEEYIARAVALARAPAALNALRRELRARMAASALCDGPRFVLALETVYRQIWQRWCASQNSGTQG